VIVGDTSVLVPAFAVWHGRHDDARAAVAQMRFVIGHAALETFSVLTRLPEPQQASAAFVSEWLARQFGDAWLAMPAAEMAELPGWLARTGIDGGAVYDALIARTAAHAGATLVSLDRRAAENYRRCGATVEWL